ncbi:MAG: hypothetical protein OER90_05450 [Gemmatimonadota bacterium]|nr:hypothetical protein [Gemmatimonadota bacterium]
MSNWIFVVTRQRDGDAWVPARETFDTRMRDAFWATPPNKAVQLTRPQRVSNLAGSFLALNPGASVISTVGWAADRPFR